MQSLPCSRRQPCRKGKCSRKYPCCVQKTVSSVPTPYSQHADPSPSYPLTWLDEQAFSLSSPVEETDRDLLPRLVEADDLEITRLTRMAPRIGSTPFHAVPLHMLGIESSRYSLKLDSGVIISEFFEITSTHQDLWHALHPACAGGTDRHGLLAKLGDSLLTTYLISLHMDAVTSAGEMHNLIAPLVTNVAMANLIRASDYCTVVPGVDMAVYSVHSLGTIFEALFAVANSIGGSRSITRIVKRYVEFCKEFSS